MPRSTAILDLFLLRVQNNSLIVFFGDGPRQSAKTTYKEVNMKKLSTIFAVLFLAVIAFSFVPVHQANAQCGPFRAFPCGAGGGASQFNIGDAPGGGDPIGLSTLELWIRNIANFLISVGVVVAVIFIIWGGLAFMFAGGDTEKADA